ncbi:MAG: transposase [SAR324 cluster bacterium]|nr:transposase [SAR324 cluster bacterium]
MPRPLRIEFPNAWYHVMNRGRRGESIFLTKDDHERFIQLLLETKNLFDLRVSAYCLMPNHYHLLVQTPQANLSRCMRHINGVYTQRFNRHHGCDSQLFRGRYKAIVIEEDAYLLEVLRYIHRNPTEAQLEKSLGDYPWTSHQGYLTRSKKWDWLNKDFLLNFFASASSSQKILYQSFVSKQEPEEISKLYLSKKWPPVLGSGPFIQEIREEYLNEYSPHTFPEVKALAPPMDEIIAEICQEYHLEPRNVLKAKRGKQNEARDVAIYLIRHIRIEPYGNIAGQFEVNSASSIASTIARVKRRLSDDSKFQDKVEKLFNRLKSK